MARKTSHCLLNAALLIPYFFVEDVYFTGFSAELCSIARTNLWYYKGYLKTPLSVTLMKKLYVDMNRRNWTRFSEHK